jgi:hypothetical protein
MPARAAACRQSRAPERKRSWQQSGVLAGSRVQLVNGLVAPRRNRPHSRRHGNANRKNAALRCRSYASSLGVGADRWKTSQVNCLNPRHRPKAGSISLPGMEQLLFRGRRRAPPPQAHPGHPVEGTMTVTTGNARHQKPTPGPDFTGGSSYPLQPSGTASARTPQRTQRLRGGAAPLTVASSRHC